MMRIIPYGDEGCLVSFGQEISRETNLKVKALYQQLRESLPQGVRSLIPSYNSLCIYFDKKILNHSQLEGHIMALNMEGTEHSPQGRLIRIPVLYGGNFGPDLEEMARFHGLDMEELTGLHTQQEYMVYTMGFMPGFAYMGDFPTRLPTPRKSNPRTVLEAGSVGLAGHQTAIYPSQSSGGWQIIGQTPIPTLLPEESKPFLIGPEDRVRFYQINQNEFEEWEKKVLRGAFKREEIYG